MAAHTLPVVPSSQLLCCFDKHVLMIQISEFHCDILIRVNNVLGQIPFLFLLLSVNGTYLLLHYDERLLQCKGQWTAESRFHIRDESRQHIPVRSVTASEGRNQACPSLPVSYYFLDHSFTQLTIYGAPTMGNHMLSLGNVTLNRLAVALSVLH